MCCETKRKIADCVKELVLSKEISKITIHDIMQKTNMSRQSFYYHFQDIYDVLDWIVIHDMIEVSDCEGLSGEEWILKIVHLLQGDWIFYKKVVRQISWPAILMHVKEPMEERVGRVLCSCDAEYCTCHTAQLHFGIQFFSTSLCYYLMDLVYQNRKISDEEILQELHFLLALWKGFQNIEDYHETKISSSLSA